MTKKEKLLEKLQIQRELNIRAARKNLWTYEVVTASDFYMKSRWHLWVLAWTLQYLYERKLTKESFHRICTNKIVPEWFKDTVDWDRLIDNHVYTKLMINLPPRFGKCLDGDTLVTLSDGTDKRIKDISVGDEVVTFDKDNYKFSTSPVTNVFDNGEKETLRIKLYSGREIVCTPNHRLLTINGWVEARNLKEYDKLIGASRIFRTEKPRLPYGYAKIMGYLVADGSYNKPTGSIEWTKSEQAQVDDLRKCLEYHGWKLHLIESEKYHYCLTSGSRSEYRNDKKTPTSELRPLLGRCNSYTKRVPEEIMNGNINDIADFLGAYFSGDGTVSMGYGGVAEYNSVSKKLLLDVQRLLFTFGIFSVLRIKHGKYKGEVHTSYRLTIFGKDTIAFYERIPVVGKKREQLKEVCEVIKGKNHYPEYEAIPKDWKKWIKSNSSTLRKNHLRVDKPYKVGTAKQVVEKIADFENNADLKRITTDEIVWERIKSIENNGIVHTYDIEVANTHCFLANGIVSHNSRSIVNFCDWILGKSKDNRIITVSYNTDLAANMSRYVRDGIMMDKVDPLDTVFSDIFPETKVAKGNSGFMKWALEGSFFNYLGTGLEGTITGVGCTCFVKGTPVLTDKGEVPIEEIAIHISEYRVLSFNEKTNRLEYQPIIASRKMYKRDTITVFFMDGNEEYIKSLDCTPEHRFFVRHGGNGYDEVNISDFEWVEAKDLKKSDFVFTKDFGVLACDGVSWGGKHDVYDLQIKDNHNFFANWVLSHNCSIIDDPVKNAEEAYNIKVLDGIWDWYRGTFLSRSENIGEGSIDIINHTRWSTQDLCGRILDNRDMGYKWLILSIPAEYEGHLACEDIIPREKYDELKSVMDKNIFLANYHQTPLDVEGRLFGTLKTYDETALAKPFEKIIAYCDTADEGSDYLACYIGGVREGEGYILDIIYTQDKMQITEPLTARKLYENKVNTAKIESNNGGKGFARNVERLLWENHHSRQTHIDWFHQTQNKMARILTGATFVQDHVYFPKDWDIRFPELYQHITTFTKDGKNKHDDGVEALVEWGKMITGEGSINSYMEYLKKLKEGR